MDNAQLSQSSVAGASVIQSNVENSVDDKQPTDAESATSSSIVQQQQDTLAVQQDAAVASGPQQTPSNVIPPQTPQQQQPLPQSQQQLPSQSIPAYDAQNVQLLKEANSQYQYQINSRYEEKTRPIYGANAGGVSNLAYNAPIVYTYNPSLQAYPYYKENAQYNQYQELGNGQRRAETSLFTNEDGVQAQYENQDQSSYVHQRSQSYSEYGRGEQSPNHDTFAYKRVYHWKFSVNFGDNRSTTHSLGIKSKLNISILM